MLLCTYRVLTQLELAGTISAKKAEEGRQFARLLAKSELICYHSLPMQLQQVPVLDLGCQLKKRLKQKRRGCRVGQGVAGSRSSQEEDDEGDCSNWRLSSAGTNKQLHHLCICVITSSDQVKILRFKVLFFLKPYHHIPSDDSLT